MWLVTSRKGPRTETNYTVGTSALLIAAANRNRKSITIQNQGGETVFLGNAGVTNSGSDIGFALFTGTSFTDNASDDPWYAVSASTNNVLHVIEVT